MSESGDKGKQEFGLSFIGLVAEIKSRGQITGRRSGRKSLALFLLG